MRTYKMKADRSLLPAMTAVLHVKRDNTTDGGGMWRLAWMVPGTTSFCYTEGECSRRMFGSRRAAVAYGLETYGETAQRWPGRD